MSRSLPLFRRSVAGLAALPLLLFGFLLVGCDGGGSGPVEVDMTPEEQEMSFGEEHTEG
ncbi:hypothetical protein [Alienimonas chondri]|uniref:Secreted protein n=1 Tax=Alienimonas chondri TaxID=2681879 RepID=A0ABX1VET1_9PLAN|nr:hypothetical protein [Alienimonas chondri]NNJ26579.1 hypothetical protein [Alienimonas chondri]